MDTMQRSAQLIQRASRNSVLAHRTIWSPMPLGDLEVIWAIKSRFQLLSWKMSSSVGLPTRSLLKTGYNFNYRNLQGGPKSDTTILILQ